MADGCSHRHRGRYDKTAPRKAPESAHTVEDCRASLEAEERPEVGTDGDSLRGQVRTTTVGWAVEWEDAASR